METIDIKKVGKDAGDLLADAIKFKNVWLESMDNPSFRMVFGHLFQEIPEEYHDEAQLVVESLKDGKISKEEAEKLVDALMDNLKRVIKPLLLKDKA